MTKEQFQGMSDENAERCVGKTVSFMRENGSLEKKKITGLLLSDQIEIERLHLEKANKYLGFKLDGIERLFFNDSIDDITIE